MIYENKLLFDGTIHILTASDEKKKVVCFCFSSFKNGLFSSLVSFTVERFDFLSLNCMKAINHLNIIAVSNISLV